MTDREKLVGGQYLKVDSNDFIDTILDGNDDLFIRFKSKDALARTLSALERPTLPESSADYQQQRGVAWDIIDQAINTYDGWMLDDDYRAGEVLREIVDKMRSRRDAFLPKEAPAEPVQAAGDGAGDKRDKAISDIAGFAALKSGWDSYSGKPITAAARSVATTVIKVAPQAVPMSNGGVQLEWHIPGTTVEIAIDPFGDITGDWGYGGPAPAETPDQGQGSQTPTNTETAKPERESLVDDKCRCHDCGREYGDDHGFPDLIIPYDSWVRISPSGDDGGLLCPSCICRRLSGAAIKCEGAFMSGPIISVTGPTMHALRRVENIELAIDGRNNSYSGIRELIDRKLDERGA